MSTVFAGHSLLTLDQCNAAETADVEDVLGASMDYLICASGPPGVQMVAGLQERVGHGDEQERLVVMAELRKIAGLRLAQAVGA